MGEVIMRQRLLLVLAFLLLICMSALAQNSQPEKWYFAFTTNTDEVIAFTAEGQTNSLLKSITLKPEGDERLSVDSALAILVSDDVKSLYYLQSDAAYRLTYAGEGTDPLENGKMFWRLIDTTSEYGIVRSLNTGDDYETNEPILLADLNKRTYDILARNRRVIPEWRFSSDGRYLRYVTKANPDENTWMLQQRKLESGDERTLHTFVLEDDYTFFSANQHGERWIARAGLKTTTMWSLSGEIETIHESFDTANSREYFNNGLLTYQHFCTGECTLNWQPETELPFNLTFPNSDEVSLYLNKVWQVDDSHLLVFADDNIWQLGADESAVLIGKDSGGDLIGIPDIVSPDSRWVLVRDNQPPEGFSNRYRMWDNREHRYILDSTNPDVQSAWVIYGEGGFVVSEDHRRHTLYRYSDSVLLPLKLPEVDLTAIDVLPDGTVLYASFVENDRANIFRYDSNTQSSTLVVADAFPLAGSFP
jgi:hypothetical protein